MAKWFIYTLRDPREGGPRYVGCTGQPNERLIAHVSHSAKARHRVGKWIDSLVRRGVRPVLDIVETIEGTEDDASNAEVRWIADHRERGIDLTNDTAGGKGASMACPASVRAKISAANTGKVRTPEQREKCRRAKLGTKHSAETRAKMSRAHTGIRRSPEAIEATASAKRGVARSDEVKQKISAALVGRRTSDETRAKMRASHLARNAAARGGVPQESKVSAERQSPPKGMTP